MARKDFFVNITDEKDREVFKFDISELGDMLPDPQKSEYFAILDTHRVVGFILDDGKPEPPTTSASDAEARDAQIVEISGILSALLEKRADSRSSGREQKIDQELAVEMALLTSDEMRAADLSAKWKMQVFGE
jgi:hypothetical protein